jgi:type II secretory pathway component GspD/PulD (secretin)
MRYRINAWNVVAVLVLLGIAVLPLASQEPGPPAAAPGAPAADAAGAVEPGTEEPAAPPRTGQVPVRLANGSDAAEEVIAVAQPEEPEAAPPATKAEELISITLDDVPLVDVIRMFTRISGANIVASVTALEGKVTVNLQDVHWKSALNSILDMHNLALVEKDLGSGVYSIVPRPADAPVPMVTKTFQLRFATVNDIGPIVRGMLPPGASLNEFASRNMLVVRSTSENLSEIQEVIKEVDQPTKQVCIETKFMELNDTATRALGMRWDSLAAFGVRLQGGPFDWTRKTVDEFTRDDTLKRAVYDQNGRQTSRNLDAEGVRYDSGDLAIVTEGTAGEGPFAPGFSTAPPYPSTIESEITGQSQLRNQDILKSFSRTIEANQAAILEMDQLQFVLSALKTADGVELVSNPKLIVANGSTNAFFSVGSREPIIRTEIQRGTTESPGDIVTAELDTGINTEYITEGYLATGIDLRVVPVVKTDDLIEAYIRPSLRRKLSDKVVANNSWPIISVKEIQTRFTLRSGQTVAIGGLTDSQDSNIETKVPLLGDIPLIGRYLFSHSSKTKEQVETIIFVTLSLAQPETLYKQVGIPEDAALIHRKLIRNQTEQLQLEAEIESLQNEADALQREQADKTRTELLKRRR